MVKWPGWKIHRPGLSSGFSLPSPAYCFASVIVWTENFKNVTIYDRFMCFILSVKRRWRPVFWGRQLKKGRQLFLRKKVHPGDLAGGFSDLEMTWLLYCAGAGFPTYRSSRKQNNLPASIPTGWFLLWRALQQNCIVNTSETLMIIWSAFGYNAGSDQPGCNKRDARPDRWLKRAVMIEFLLAYWCRPVKEDGVIGVNPHKTTITFSGSTFHRL